MNAKPTSNIDNYWLKKDGDKQNVFKIEKENSYKDAEYVKLLGSWEKTHLPKISTKISQ